MTTIHISKGAEKPNKAGALRRVLDLHAGRGDSAELIEEILLYFTAPPARKPAKTAMEWVARAVAAQDVRHYLTYLRVSPEGIAYGTNGHRAHFAAVEGVAPGYYDPKTLKPVEVEGKYPDVNRLMPRTSADQCVAVAELGTAVGDMTLYTSDGAACMQAYLNDALNGCDSLPIDIHGQGGALHYWSGVNEFGTYLVTGVRI